MITRPLNPSPSKLALFPLFLALSLGCGGAEDGTETQPVTPTAIPATPTPGPTLDGELPYETLSEYHFFGGEMAALSPVPGVLPFEVASPLWTDNALKYRFMVVPEGESIGFDATGNWVWPVNTVLIKNFVFPKDWRDPEGERRIIETRLLIHETEGDWSSHTYVWNDEQTEAKRTTAGKRVVIEMADEAGVSFEQTYLVPNTNECGSCHEVGDVFFPMGPVTPQINTEVERDGSTQNQLEWMVSQGLFDAAPPAPEDLPALVDPREDGDLEVRARSWMHANCAHCHQQDAAAHKSGLFLAYDIEEPQTYGVCKTPVAAGGGSGGLLYDIVPGDPESSILVYRIHSTDPEIKMPELGNLYIDELGVKLVEDWIRSMDAVDCDTFGGGI